jgi:hypothetical protein
MSQFNLLLLLHKPPRLLENANGTDDLGAAGIEPLRSLLVNAPQNLRLCEEVV